MRSIVLVLLMMLSVSGFSQAKSDGAADQAESIDPPVKKSKTGICHAQGSKYYSQTKKFTPFKTLDECLKSGGRLPKR